MRIVVTGRHEDARSALAFFLGNQPDLDVVAEVEDIRTLQTQAEAAEPDVILLDWEMCNRPLADLISALHRLECRPGLVLINVPAESQQAALDAGADACIARAAPSKRLLIAVESIRLIREEESREQRSHGCDV